MKPIKLFVVAIALTVCAPAAAEEFAPITSAWGVKLGQVWTDKSRPVEELDYGAQAFKFKPVKPTPGLAEYAVAITSPANRVIAIFATGNSDSLSTDIGRQVSDHCDWAHENILPHLEKKYGEATKEEGDPVFIYAGNVIMLDCDGDDFALVYADKDLFTNLMDQSHEKTQKAIEESDL